MSPMLGVPGRPGLAGRSIERLPKPDAKGGHKERRQRPTSRLTPAFGSAITRCPCPQPMRLKAGAWKFPAPPPLLELMTGKAPEVQTQPALFTTGLGNAH